MTQHTPSSLFRFPNFDFCGSILGMLLICTSGIASAADEVKLTIAPPEQLTLTTPDGVELHATWYAGGVAREQTKLKKVDFKDVVPIIIVHGWGDSSDSFSAIASYLQSLGHAVIVPDLRGHGNTKLIRGNREIERDNFSRNDIAAMAMIDVVRVKKFLLEKNNAKQLNIELLCVIGSEEGAIVAANWAVRDWSLLNFINRKQGKDVKGIILISPMRMHNGYTLNNTLKAPVFSGLNPAVFTIPTMIIVGRNNPEAYQEAKTIHSRLETSRKRLHQSISDEDRAEKHTLYLVEPETNAQGAALLDPRRRLNLHLRIKGFVEFKLATKSTDDFYKWTDRSHE